MNINETIVNFFDEEMLKSFDKGKKEYEKFLDDNMFREFYCKLTNAEFIKASPYSLEFDFDNKILTCKGRKIPFNQVVGFSAPLCDAVPCDGTSDSEDNI